MSQKNFTPASETAFHTIITRTEQLTSENPDVTITAWHDEQGANVSLEANGVESAAQRELEFDDTMYRQGVVERYLFMSIPLLFEANIVTPYHKQPPAEQAKGRVRVGSSTPLHHITYGRTMLTPAANEMLLVEHAHLEPSHGNPQIHDYTLTHVNRQFEHELSARTIADTLTLLAMRKSSSNAAKAEAHTNFDLLLKPLYGEEKDMDISNESVLLAITELTNGRYQDEAELRKLLTTIRRDRSEVMEEQELNVALEALAQHAIKQNQANNGWEAALIEPTAEELMHFAGMLSVQATA